VKLYENSGERKKETELLGSQTFAGVWLMEISGSLKDV
jgi:hypothetical protein